MDRSIGRGTAILGIDTSCDDTAAAVVVDGREILSSIVLSQASEHAVYGGVVPEIAGRSHLRAILPVIERALTHAGLDLDDIDAVAVTNRPGLMGSLLVGLSAAKAMAFVRDLPLLAVDHLEAHAYSGAMEREPAPYPCAVLIVSGGHTSLYRATSPLDLALLGGTLDDAAGEAFDKVAWLLGLEYPGGPAISRLAEQGRRDAIEFPRFRAKRALAGNAELAFSFSGLKTAVLYHLRGQDALAPTPPPHAIQGKADIAASFEEALVDQLVFQTVAGARSQGLETVLVVGGVACNRRLRARMREACSAAGIEAVFPSPAFCTDNAAMVAGLGYHMLGGGRTASFDVDASASSRPLHASLLH